MGNEALGSATLQFSADPRLAAAAGGAARYFADTAGMESDVAAKLQAATLLVCGTASEHDSSADIVLSVEVILYTNRIEIAVAHGGEPNQKLTALAGVDRIENTTQGGSAVTRLTKYVSAPPA